MKKSLYIMLCLIFSLILVSVPGNATDVGQVWQFDYTGSEVIWTPPITGKYKIEAWGAQGGNYQAITTGGRGAYSTGTIVLEATSSLKLRVGKKGKDALGWGDWADGGDGSYVKLHDNTILVVAGGGGGAGSHQYWGSTVNYDGGAGLGTIGTSTADGHSQNYFTAKGGKGIGGSCIGGSGNYESNSWTYVYGGGGGGYGGGDGAYNGNSSGGGTSYRIGSNQAGTSGVRTGNGMIKITLMEVTDIAYLTKQAKEAAEQAKVSADTAANNASQAKTEAINAKNAANSAKTSADNAKLAADGAKAEATAAKTNALNAYNQAQLATNEATAAKNNALAAVEIAQIAIDQTIYNNKTSAEWSSEAVSKADIAVSQTIYEGKSAAQWASENRMEIDNLKSIVSQMEINLIDNIKNTDKIPPRIIEISWKSGKSITSNSVELLNLVCKDETSPTSELMFRVKVDNNDFGVWEVLSNPVIVDLGTSKGLIECFVEIKDEADNVEARKISIWKI